MPKPSPDRRLLLFALGLTATIALFLWLRDGRAMAGGFGDTDDATRIVMMRELAHGRGWWDQLMTRLQPPYGAWMHWSRLIDGGLAGMDRAFAAFVGEARAEYLTRLVWPLLWIFPGVAAILIAARRLAGPGERGAGLADGAELAAGAIALVYCAQLTLQFHPGRVDHHDVQIVLALVAMAGAMTRGPGLRGAVVSAVATGIGLAIGLEALLFEAAFAASFGLRFLVDRGEAARARAFGLTLAGVTLAAFLIQTPPERWGVPACDALGSNLLAGALSAGIGLAAAAHATRRRDWPWRLAALALAGGMALGVYLALDPRCTRGIFADVDPAIRPFWLDHVNEVKPIAVLWKTEKEDAFAVMAAAAMGLVSWAALGLARERRRDAAWWLMGAAIALGIAAAFTAIRMRSYLEWFVVAPLAVCAAEAGRRAGKSATLMTVLAAVMFAPVLLTSVILIAVGLAPVKLAPSVLWLLGALVAGSVGLTVWRVVRTGWRSGAALAAITAPLAGFVALLLFAHGRERHLPPPKPEPVDRCYDTASYAPLARAPKGLAISEIDLGPFVLAHTPSSVMSAPYHRMSTGILLARGVVTAPADGPGPDGAQARALALGAAARLPDVYILECRVHARHADRDHIPKDSLQAVLDRGRVPVWLSPLTTLKAGLQIYRVAAAPTP